MGEEVEIEFIQCQNLGKKPLISWKELGGICSSVCSGDLVAQDQQPSANLSMSISLIHEQPAASGFWAFLGTKDNIFVMDKSTTFASIFALQSLSATSCGQNSRCRNRGRREAAQMFSSGSF